MLNRIAHKCIGYVRRNAALRERAKQVVLPLLENTLATDIPEITPLDVRFTDEKCPRLTLLVPSVNQAHIFGGIATALTFFDALASQARIRKRIITTDTMPDPGARQAFCGYDFISSTEDTCDRDVIVGAGDRAGRTFPVGENDYFMATSWWTAFHAQKILSLQKEKYGRTAGKLLYFIQDFEPGFYPWSARYALADSTYRSGLPVAAVFNSSLLHAFFVENKYGFDRAYVFEPVLNAKLAESLSRNPVGSKKKQILIYGRPGVERNAFPLIVSALKSWVWKKENIREWEFLSAGESHPPVDLGNGMILRSAGKLSLDAYVEALRESALGISLMVSPHPSYPPMEMAMFGLGVISNTYANKELSRWHENIHSIDLSLDNLVRALDELSGQFDADSATFVRGRLLKKEYMDPENQFSFMPELAQDLFGHSLPEEDAKKLCKPASEDEKHRAQKAEACPEIIQL